MKKKKISVLSAIALFVQLLAVPSVNAADTNEYDMYVEAENYVSTNWSEIKADSTASNGKYLSLYNSSAPLDCYYAEYTVSASEAGVYDMDIAASPVLNSTWSSDIYVQANSDKAVKLTGEMIAVATSQCSWYHVDSLNLNKGDNTIRIFVKDKRADGIYVAFFDSFGLKKSESKVRYITSDAPFNVFEQSDEIVMKIQTNNQVTQKTPVSWSVVNVYGQSVASGRVYVEQGENTATFSLYNLPKGYYEATAAGISSGLCVVKPLEDRTKYPDTPFAMDAAFGGLINRLPHYDEEYAKVLALSGVSWIRDRADFKDTISYADGNFNISNGNTFRAGTLLEPYGIKVSTAVDLVPSALMSEYSNVIPDNLPLAYEMWKQVAEKFDGYVDNWEIMNEADLGGLTSSSDSPDLYAAYMKAAALGIADANTKEPMTAMTQGAAERIDSEAEYIRTLMRNDVFDYSVADNAHSHIGAYKEYEKYYQYSGVGDAQNHLYYQKLHDAASPLWVTESGIAITSDTRGNFSRDEQMVQAKYLVTSAVESIASGTDKHFFFIGQNYNEGEKEWGMMSDELVNPYMYASLSAQSAMTDLLGEGLYEGELTELPQGVHGYVFKTGGKRAAVLWSEGEAVSVGLEKTPEAVYDMFGNEKASASALTVTDEPVYAVFTEGLSGIKNNRREMMRTAQPEFTDADKVILVQKFDDIQRGGARFGGYHINDDNNTVTVEVTNLSGKVMSGTVNGEFERGWTLENPSEAITVEPGETESITFTLNKRYDIPFDYLTFYGMFNGEKTSASTTKLTAYNSNSIRIEAEENAEYYDEAFVKGAESLVAVNTENESRIVFKPFIMQTGLYDVQVLGAGEYKLYVNGKCSGEVNLSALTWKRNGNIRLEKGINEIAFVAAANSSTAAELDKIIISKPRENGLWIEAEDYSEKSGYYMKRKMNDSSNGHNMKIFTFGIENPTKDNKLSYDFFVEKTNKYDVWILSSKANVQYLTKWKFGLDSSCSYPSYLTRQISAGYSEDNIEMFWHRVKQNVSLNEGFHNLTILSDEERTKDDGTYMLHIADAIVIAEAGKWTPSGNLQTDRENYKKLYPDNITVSFNDALGQSVDKATDATAVSVEVHNTFDKDISVNVFCAAYNAFSGKLLGVETKSIDVTRGNTGMLDLQLNKADDSSVATVYEVFSWDDEMTPYAAYSSIDGAWDALNKPVKTNEKIYISGSTGKAGESVSVMVLKPSDVPYEQMNALELLGAIEYVNEIKTDFDGEFFIKYDAEEISDGAVIRIGSNTVNMKEQIAE